MRSFVPREVFLTRGVGVHKFRLSSFEDALRNAGVANQNLVSVSSILPPGCKIISKEEGLSKMTPGSIRFTVIARIDTDEHDRRIAASIGIAQPKETSKWGYLSEVHGFGLTHRQTGDMAEDLAASMLGTTLGIEINPDEAWVEREKLYKATGLIVHTSNITQTASGKSGLWTTAVAMAVFLI
ncbi:arginine decarboxylase, pyruvoyl-dependent [bacterium]|nr:arginine decarboxylase, pyruvoyl-dependent [bacterium]